MGKVRWSSGDGGIGFEGLPELGVLGPVVGAGGKSRLGWRMGRS